VPVVRGGHGSLKTILPGVWRVAGSSLTRIVRYRTVFRIDNTLISDVVYNFFAIFERERMAKKTPTRRLPELPPDFPSTAMSLYEKESRIADAKLAAPQKKKKLRKNERMHVPPLGYVVR
jgi:hypothetical protein